MRLVILIGLTIFGFLALPQIATAQDASNAQARAFFFAAEDALESRNYDEAYRALKRAEAIRGGTDARFLELEAKILVALGKDKEALTVIEKFYKYDASPELLRGMAQLQLGVEEREEVRQAEEARLTEQRRLAEIRRLQHEKEQRQKDAETARRLAPIDVVEQGERAAQVIIQSMQLRANNARSMLLKPHKSFDARRKRVKGKKGSYGAFFEVLDVTDFSISHQCQSEGRLHQFYDFEIVFRVSTYKKSKRIRTKEYDVNVRGLSAKLNLLTGETGLVYTADPCCQRVIEANMPKEIIGTSRVGGVNYTGHPSEEFYDIISPYFHRPIELSPIREEFALAMQKDPDLFVEAVRDNLVIGVDPCI